MTERIGKAEAFLREQLAGSPYFAEHPEALAYRLEHTFRVARIGRAIAGAEGMDQEAMTIACLLHDVSYGRDFAGEADWKDHGRASARIARPFLEQLGLAAGTVEEICYGVAIHVDDKADFPGDRTAFACTVGDADNIDRFDVYRLYETLETIGFRKLNLGEKRTHVEKTLERLEGYLALPFATATAVAMWRERITCYLDFYRRLDDQLSASVSFSREPAEISSGAPGPAASRL